MCLRWLPIVKPPLLPLPPAGDTSNPAWEYHRYSQTVRSQGRKSMPKRHGLERNHPNIYWCRKSIFRTNTTSMLLYARANIMIIQHSARLQLCLVIGKGVGTILINRRSREILERSLHSFGQLAAPGPYHPIPRRRC